MTNKKNFIIGSRGSKLSLAYSGHIKNLLINSNKEFIKNNKVSNEILENIKYFETRINNL